MSVRLTSRRPTKGTNAASLRKMAMIFLAAGVIGRTILCNALLGVDSLTNEQLLTAVDATPYGMTILTVALLCQAAETCAVPLFSFLLVEGYLRTSSFEKYLIRVAGLAVITEIPYNLACSGSLLQLGSRNPVFGLVVCLVMLHFFNRFPEKSFKNIAVKVMIFLAAFLWCLMLRIDHGIFLVIMVGMLWLVREKDNMRAIYGFCAAMVCTLFNMYYIASCLSVISLHRYNEEQGDQNTTFNYAFYPVILLAAGIAAKFL